MKFLVLSLLLVLGAFTAVAQEEADEGSLDDANALIKCIFTNNSAHYPAMWHFSKGYAPLTLNAGESKEVKIQPGQKIYRRDWKARTDIPESSRGLMVEVAAAGSPLQPPPSPMVVSGVDTFQVECKLDKAFNGYTFIFSDTATTPPADE